MFGVGTRAVGGFGNTTELRFTEYKEAVFELDAFKRKKEVQNVYQRML